MTMIRFKIYANALCFIFCFFINQNVMADVQVGFLKYSLSGNNATITGYDPETIPEELVIPESIEYNGLKFMVTAIGKSAFKKCAKIKSLTTTHKVTDIGASAFQECTDLEMVTAFGNIGDYAFRSCEALKEIKVVCNYIYPYAFSGCTNLEKVTLDEVIDIYGYAFYGCSKMKWIVFGKKLKRIGTYSFGNCTSLNYLVFPSTRSYICPDCYKSSEGDYGAARRYNYWFNDWGDMECDYGESHSSDHRYLTEVKCPFTGCNFIQSVIFLGWAIETGLSNVNIYSNVKSFLTWNDTEFQYTGKVPSLSFTNNLPAGFVATAYDMSNIEINAGKHSVYIPVSFTNADMSFDVDIPFTYTISPVTAKAKVKDASRLYGDSDPAFETVYSGFVNGEDANVVTSQGTYSTEATVKSDVGTYSIHQFGATAQNYVFEYEDGTLTINKAPLTVKAIDKSMTYGSPLPTLNLAYDGLKNNETQPKWETEPVLECKATSSSKVGTYPITIKEAVAVNYDLTCQSGNLTVEKANLTIRPDNKNREYGDANPQLTMIYTGLKNDETEPEWEKAPTLETNATNQSPVGTYPISVKDAVAVNYNINAVDGTLTINKAQLEVSPRDVTRKYGEQNPAFELMYVGLKNQESTPEWTEEPVISTNANQKSSVGDYTIQVTSGEARNYMLVKHNGTLSITKAPLSVALKSYTRKYGEANPNFELSYQGLVNDETAPAWITMPDITTEATSKSDVGEYAITATGGEMRNYETTGISAGKLTVTPVSLLIKAKDASRPYFEEGPDFSYTCTGFVNYDNESVLVTKPQITTSAVKTSNAGVYPIEISGAEAKNYVISYEKGQLTINKRQVTVSTKDYTRTYGEENPEFELFYKGFVNLENEDVCIMKPQVTTEATTTSDTGIYPIVIGNGVAENYDFSYVNGQLTIEKAYQTLAWDQTLEEVVQYSQVELTAVASSGLDVTYSIEGDEIGVITRIGGKQFLDCYGEGQAVVIAIQEGNQNYWQTTKIYKPIKIIPTAVRGLEQDMSNNVRAIFDAAGRKLNKLQRGMNVLLMKDGCQQKVLVK